MSLFMLDTDTVSFFLRGQSTALDARISRLKPKQLCISAVTRAELVYGIQLKDGAHRMAAVVDAFLMRIQCLSWDARAATAYGKLAATLQKAGTPIGHMDALIAGHALASDAVLVTNNMRHFSRVAGLNIENWSQEH